MPIRYSVATLLLLAALAQAEVPNPRVIERYKQMLAANPTEGVALERLWKAALESGTTDALLAEYTARQDFAGRMILGHLYRRVGRDADALKAFQAAAKLDPRQPLPALALAKLESDRGAHRAAAGWMEKAVAALPEGDPRRLETLLQLGSAWLAAGNKTLAAETWERIIALSPDDLEVRRRLATAYAENLLPEAALRHFEYIAEKGTPADRAGAFQQIARLHSGAGHPGKALEALERAVAFTAPGNWLRSELQGQIVRLAQRQHAEAELEAKWKAQAEASPRDLGASLQMVEFYERVGNLDQQVAWLEKISALMPRAAEYRLKLARALVQLDRLDAAEAEYEQLLKEQPGNVDLVFERARLDVQRENPAEARKRIGAVLALRKSDETLRSKALQFYREHRLFDLVEELLKADAATGNEDALGELANFYFAQRRKEEAIPVLAKLVRPTDPPERQAAAHFRIAQTLKAQGELPAAAEALQAAAQIQSKSRDLQIFRGELELAMRRFDVARDAFSRAYALSTTESERQEADAKMFETFRAETPTVGEDGRPSRSSEASMAARVEGFIRELMRVATERKDAASWMRVAQWKAWNSDRASAVTFAGKAADLEPKNPVPREFLARLATSHGDTAMALMYLRELAEMNPGNRAAYLREIAQIEMQRGDTRIALGMLLDIARENPGNAEALADVALAQERAGNFEEAARTWRKVVEISPVPKKREAGASLLRVLQQLGRHEDAAEWLLRAVDETGDDQERSRRFDELLLHARQHELLTWLRGKFEERRKVRADDYFIAMALGRILKIAGDKEGAFELFADAVFSAPNQSEALPDLIREAEDLRRLEVAVKLQEQLTRVVAQDRPDDLLKLAALYFRTGDIDGAEQTWIRSVARFPREVEVVRRAAEFHQQWGDPERARVLLKKLAVLEPADVRVALEWADLEWQLGRDSDAQAAYETVLRISRPVTHRLYPARLAGCPWGERGVFTGTARVARVGGDGVMLSMGWRSVPQNSTIPPNPEVEPRLRAIARLGVLAARAGGERRARWVQEWTASLPAQPVDALWALYFGGAESAALQEVQKAMVADPVVDGHRQAFVWMAMESGAWEDLHRWLNADGRSAKEIEWFSQAFSAVVMHHPERVTSGMLQALFPRGNSARIWPAALELARAQRFAEALLLGRRVWGNLSSRRPEVGRELSRWHLAIGQRAEATEILRSAASGSEPSLESPSILAAWELFHLLPEEQRGSFLKSLRGEGNEPPALLRRLVAGILSGDDEEARKSLIALLAQHPLGAPGGDETNAVTRFWEYWDGTQRQLLAWGRADLVLSGWEAVASDPALLAWWRLQKVREKVEGGHGGLAEIWVQKRAAADADEQARGQMRVIEFLLADPARQSAMLAESGARGSGALEQFAEGLESVQADGAATAFFAEMWRREPGNPGVLRRLLDAARKAGDSERSEELRRRVVASRAASQGDDSTVEIALELSDLLEQRGAGKEASALLQKMEARARDFRVSLRLAQVLERSGQSEEAAKVWQRLLTAEEGHAAARQTLAMHFEVLGKYAEAIAVRTRAGSGGGDAHLPVLYAKARKTDEALLSLDRLGGSQAVYAAMAMADEWGLRGEPGLARSVLLSTAQRMSEPRAQLQLQTKLLTIPGAPASASFAQRSLARLSVLAERHEELLAPYLDFFEAYAGRLGLADAWQARLHVLWAGGKGKPIAGTVLLKRAVAGGQRDVAVKIVGQLLARPETPTPILERMEAILSAPEFADLRLQVLAVRAGRDWPFADATFAQIRHLDRSGRREAARELLLQSEWLAAYGGGPETLGHLWLELGDSGRAGGFYQAARVQNSLVPTPSLLAGTARVELAGKRTKSAWHWLRRAFAIPGCREYRTLIEYLAVTQQLERWAEVCTELGLTAARRYQFQAALFAWFEEAGRLPEALALVARDPSLVTPWSETEAWPVYGTSLDRIRALARKTGGFAETARLLDQLIQAGVPDAKAARAALDADRADAAHESSLAAWKEASRLSPTHWDYARAAAEGALSAGDAATARGILERYLHSARNPVAREKAFVLWEKTRR